VPGVSPVWTEKCRNGLYVGECPIYGLTFRLEKTQRGWAAVVWIHGERIESFSTTAKEAALATLWQCSKVENLCKEYGIPHRLNWGEFRYFAPTPLQSDFMAKPARKTAEYKKPAPVRASDPAKFLRLQKLLTERL
jgi:hypothetical protein